MSSNNNSEFMGLAIVGAIIGMAMSFPASRNRTTVEYQVNTKYWLDRYGDDEDDV